MKLTRAKTEGERAFTMIEIAIAIGVIGFALVAIIGILPRGLNVQKDNRENAIIDEDANYLVDAIRNGVVYSNTALLGQGLDFMTNYMERIVITNSANSNNPAIFTNSPGPGFLINGANILGLLSTPMYYYTRNDLDYLDNPPPSTNYVRAYLRALNGSAMTQGGSNSVVAFRYAVDVRITPFTSFPYNVYGQGADTAVSNGVALPHGMYMNQNLYEARLTFSWPVLGDTWSVGPNRQTYRTLIAGHLTNVNSGRLLWFFQGPTFNPKATGS